MSDVIPPPPPIPETPAGPEQASRPNGLARLWDGFKRLRWWGKTLIALGILATLGAATQASTITRLEDDKTDLAATIAELETQLATTEHEAVSTRAELESRIDALKETITAEQERADGAEAAAKRKVERENLDRLQRLDRRAKALDDREADLVARERAVAEAEGRIAANSFEDGVYEVGRDIEPGTYRAPGSSGCYWARQSSPDETDIISNHYGAGQVVATLNAGEFFRTDGCGTWVKS
jgi:hypothetical protein